MEKFEHIKVVNGVRCETDSPWRTQCVAFSMPYVTIELGKKYGNVVWSDQTFSDEVRAFLKERSQGILDGLLNIGFRYKNPQSTCKISFDVCVFSNVDRGACEALAADVFDFLCHTLGAQMRSIH